MKKQKTHNQNKDGSTMRAVAVGGSVMFIPDTLDRKKPRSISYRELAGKPKRANQNQNPLTAFARLGKMVKGAFGKRKAA